MKRWLVAGLTALAVAPALAASIPKGTTEARVGVAYQFEESDGNSGIPVYAGMGYYVADNFQLGGKVSLVKKEFESYWGQGHLWSLSVYGEYELPLGGPINPYGGLSLGMSDDDSTERDAVFFLGLQAGARYYVTDLVALALTLGLDVAEEDIYDARFDQTGGQATCVSLGAGLRFLF